MNRFLRSALFGHISPYSAVLPYNLNWMLGRRSPLLAHPACGPITIVDVGCRGGLPDEVWPLRHLIHHVGFDADQAECDRLNAQPHDLLKRELFPLFIGGANGVSEFHLFHRPGDSSALRPDERFARLFGGAEFAIKSSVQVQTSTLDTFFKDRPDMARPDMIKLDTQGTELHILRGASECLRTASLVEVEVEFLPMYEGQPLFPDVMRLMLDAGFELLFLNRVVQQREGYTGYSKGQITFGDAIFARREDRCEAFDEARLVRYMILLINLGHIDFAYNVFKAHRFSDQTRTLLDTWFRHKKSGWFMHRVKRLTISSIDKVILLLMHLRRHNGLPIDSDRSWPNR